jgi:hypothetical protein
MMCTPTSGAPYCADTNNDAANCGTCGKTCSTGQVCQSGNCVSTCGSSATAMVCNGSCVDTNTDNANCGTCSKACLAGTVCSGGTCQPDCGALKPCTDSTGLPYCADEASDPSNCGACGKTCQSGQLCKGGNCVAGCSGGTSMCTDATTGNLYCADLKNDPQNCEMCGTACAAGEVCQGGCHASCSGGTSMCTDATTGNLYCADLKNDPKNCEMCGNACADGQVCQGGCQASCAGGTSQCTDAKTGNLYCADLQNDPKNCMTCGNACATGQVCLAGVCTSGCFGTGQTLCGSSCVDVTTNSDNCGTCGNSCFAGGKQGYCTGGACITCSGSTPIACANQCISVTYDVNNCGGCGTMCPAGDICANGSCRLPEAAIADWPFNVDGGDYSGHGNAAVLDASSSITAGSTWAANALSLPGRTPGATAPHIDFTGAFTVEAWVFTSDFAGNGNDVSVLGQCDSTTPNHCLHLVIRNGYAYEGFYSDDMSGTVRLSNSNWHHVAWVSDGAGTMSLYVDGALDVSQSGHGLYAGTAAPTWIGQEGFGIKDEPQPVQIDSVVVYNTVLTAAEIQADYETASHATFDASNLLDSTTNHADGTNNGGVTFGAGHTAAAGDMAASFDGSATGSYVSGPYAALGGLTPAYSIEMWVNPTAAAAGELAHVSTTPDGAGWCTPFLGVTGTGAIVTQAWNGGGDSEVIGPSLTPGTWTHVAATWSTPNGLRLYINGALIDSTAVTFSGAGQPAYLTVGGPSTGTGCSTLDIPTAPFAGAVDDVQVFGVERIAAEIAADAGP